MFDCAKTWTTQQIVQALLGLSIAVGFVTVICGITVAACRNGDVQCNDPNFPDQCLAQKSVEGSGDIYRCCKQIPGYTCTCSVSGSDAVDGIMADCHDMNGRILAAIILAILTAVLCLLACVIYVMDE